MSNREPRQIVDHLFRHESGRMVAVLTHIFGMHNLDLVEDVVQDAFVKAVQSWTYTSVPDNPAAWLMQVAKRKAIDILRRNARGTEILSQVTGQTDYAFGLDEFFHEDEIADSQLRLIFACCHPSLKPSDQVALTLKTASGFGIREIARALMVSEDNVKQRLFRARKYIKDNDIDMHIPTGAEMSERLATVHTVIYLIFNEGYSSAKGDEVIRRDLCAEAMRLAKLLFEHKRGGQGSTCALLALMCFHAARFDARLGLDDQIVLLHEQDRSIWDGELLKVGKHYFHKALQIGPTTVYHIEMLIASQHVWHEVDRIDWPRLRKLYEVLYDVKPSPVIKLNMLVVVLRQGDLEAASKLAEELTSADQLQKNHLLYAVLSEYHQYAGNYKEAVHSIEKAIELGRTSSEKKLLRRRLKALEHAATNGVK